MDWSKHVGKGLSAASIVALYLSIASALMLLVRDSVLQGDAGLIAGLAFVAVTSALLYLLLKKWHQKRAGTQAWSEAIAQHFYNQPFIGMTLASAGSQEWIAFNERMCAMLGYSREEFSGKTWKDLIHPEDQAASQTLVEALLQGQSDGVSVPLRYVCKDGSTLHVQVNLHCVRKPDGQPDFFVATVMDISRLKESEEKIAFQNEMLETMAKMVRIGGWMVDLSTMQVIRTKEIARIYGANLGPKLDVQTAIENFPPEARESIRKAAWKAMQDGADINVEVPLISAHGHRLWVRVQGKAIREDGKVVRLQGAFQDITEQKQQEEEIKKLLREMQTLLRNTTVGIMHVRHRTIVSCNRRQEEMFGYGSGELAGQSTQVLYPDEETFERSGQRGYAALRRGESYSEELNLKHKEGHLIRCVLTGNALDPEQPQEGSIWSYIDVSEGYQAREEARRLLQAIEQSPVPVIIFNRDGQIDYVNPAFSLVTGYTREEALGQDVRACAWGGQTAEFYQAIWDDLCQGKRWRGLLCNQRKDGLPLWEQATIMPIYGSENEISHFIMIKEDVTELKQALTTLGRYKEHLEEVVNERTAELSQALDAALLADRAKDDFLANVSHELRTPLNVVIGFADLARRTCTDTKQLGYLGKISEAGKNLCEIINDLLDLSKIASGHLEFESMMFNLPQVLEKVRSSMMPRVEEKRIALNLRVDPLLPELVIGDPLRVEQILMNLVSNAVKFTSIGGVEVRVNLAAREAERVGLEIEVEDTGIGIHPEKIKGLFKPFVQADSSITREYGGTGLGLALCKRLAEMMGGEIGVTSQEGKGSVFRVRLWLRSREMGEAAAASPGGTKEASGIRYQNVHVLVVDDQPTNLEIAEELLAAVGIVTQRAINGQEALKVLLASGRDAFDLVLMDIQMPVLDGLTATQKIRAIDGFENLPIIAMTAHTMEHEKKRFVEAGVNDHIGKPYEAEQFYRILEKWIPRIKQKPDAGLEKSSDVEFPRLTGIDTGAGLSRFAGKVEQYRHWLLNFSADTPEFLARVRSQVAAGQLEEARKTVHALKGRAGMLGMNELMAKTAALEEQLQNSLPPEEMLAAWQRTVEDLSGRIDEGLRGLESKAITDKEKP